jgi:NodT family efflux transporter outer membrane factor (OMF) lipoprotein
MRAALLAAALLLAGCEVGPDYVAPDPKLPANWTEQKATEAQSRETLLRQQQWWKEFKDPALDRLVGEAVTGNLDLAIARQRLVSARAERVVAGANDYPQVGALAGASWSRSSTTAQYPPGIGEYRTFTGGFDAAWELDIFGGTQRGKEAADAEIGAYIEDRRAILVSLLSELATDYVTLRATQQRIGIANSNINLAKQALDLTSTEFNRGLTTSLAVAQARAQMETVQASLPPLRAQVAQLTHAIAVLLGRMPGELEAQLSVPAPAVPVPPDLPLSMPSEVIANRPDIRRAERRFAAATARIGVAIAQRYPHFSIPLALSPTTSYLSEAFQGASLMWNVGMSISQTVYSGGRLTAREQEAKAAAEAARLGYQQTVLNGFREVEDALIAYSTDTQRAATLSAAVRDDRLADDHARRLYAAGLIDFLNVLTTERALYAAQDQQALTELSRVKQMIALYKSIGGGWQATPFGDEVPDAEKAANKPS